MWHTNVRQKRPVEFERDLRKTRDLQKRPTQKTYARDLQKRHRKQPCKRALEKRPNDSRRTRRINAKKTYAQDLHTRTTHKTYTRDLCTRPSQEPFKIDLEKSLAKDTHWFETRRIYARLRLRMSMSEETYESTKETNEWALQRRKPCWLNRKRPIPWTIPMNMSKETYRPTEETNNRHPLTRDKLDMSARSRNAPSRESLKIICQKRPTNLEKRPRKET